MPASGDRGDDSEDPVTVLRKRRAQVSEGIEQLQDPRAALERSRTDGLTVYEAMEAQEHAERSHGHAERAPERAVKRHKQVAPKPTFHDAPHGLLPDVSQKLSYLEVRRVLVALLYLGPYSKPCLGA
jgi:hypothetical protein